MFWYFIVAIVALFIGYWIGEISAEEECAESLAADHRELYRRNMCSMHRAYKLENAKAWSLIADYQERIRRFEEARQ